MKIQLWAIGTALGAALTVQAKPCADFSGNWKGKCLSPDEFPATLQIEQKGCEMVSLTDENGRSVNWMIGKVARPAPQTDQGITSTGVLDSFWKSPKEFHLNVTAWLEGEGSKFFGKTISSTQFAISEDGKTLNKTEINTEIVPHFEKDETNVARCTFQKQD